MSRAPTAILIAICLASSARAADEALLLAVRVNGYAIGQVGEFVLRDGALFARRGELKDLGFNVPPPLDAGADSLIGVDAIPGFKWRLDAATQTLDVMAPDTDLIPHRLGVDAPADRGGVVESGTGATLNYDLTATSVAGRTSGAGLLDVRAFSPWGVVGSGVLAHAGGATAAAGGKSAVRLDTTYVFAYPAQFRRYAVGDFITGGLGWTRSLRLGGVQLSSDFSLRPDLITFPLPTLSGSAAVPSTVDILINGARLLSSQVAPGPFVIPQLPVGAGAGDISLAVTNALGRQVVVNLPFYASSALLAPGLQTYSAQLGFVRRGFGVLSDDYGDLAGVANYRRGLSNTLTVEAAAEGAPGIFMGGGGAVYNFANLAMVNVAAAGSLGGGSTGAEFNAGVQRLDRTFSFGGMATVASRDFRDVAALNGDPVTRLMLTANLSVQLRRLGSLSATYAREDRDAAPTPVVYYATSIPTSLNVSPQSAITYFQPAQHARLVSANYSIQIRKLSIYATVFRDFAVRNSTGGLIGLTIPLGGSRSAGAVYGAGSGGRTVQVQSSQSAPAIGDWGYQAFASKGQDPHEFLQVQYRAPWALVTAGVDHAGFQAALALETQGSLSYLDGRVFAANAINDSFAVVDTDGIANVGVLDENRDKGRTDASGRRLVPDLRAFDINRIAIEPNDVPADATVAFTTREVRPQERSGVVVRFPMALSHGALLILVDPSGAPLPVGATAILKATGAAFPIGFDGDTYVLDLAAHNVLLIERPDGKRCETRFEYRPIKGDIPTIGPLVCGRIP